MIIRRITADQKDLYNHVIGHPVQSWQWGDFKQTTGMEPVRLGVFDQGRMIAGYQILFRSIPKTPFKVGHCLRTPLPDKAMIEALLDLAQEENAIFIKLEPDYVVRRWSNQKGKIVETPIKEKKFDFEKLGLVRAEKALYDNDSFELDLTKSEDQLLANMHSKTRYNIRLAEKRGVLVKKRSDQKGLEIFLDLFQQTLKRQKFYFHNPDYFKQMWPTLYPAGMAEILVAEFQGQALAAWMLFSFKDRLFYPYGASSSEHRQLMASNLLCWQAIRLGKEKRCKKFDLWGGLGPKADKNHPWYGFHRFKMGYGPDLIEYAGSWDLVADHRLYSLVLKLDQVRWRLLNLKKKLRL